MSNFTTSELTLLSAYFNTPITAQTCELGEFFLENSSLDHPIGDRLEIQPNGYIVTFSQSQEHPHPYFFARNLAQFLLALQLLKIQEI